MSDEQLVEGCANNPRLFGQLYDRYIEKIYKFIYYKTLHKETAEDLTSLVFTKAWSNISTFNQSKGSFSAWLYRIARNAVIDHYRGHKFEDDIDSYSGLFSHQDMASEVDVRQLLETVKKQLDSFKPQQREIILLRLWDQLSYKEISQITGLSEDNCKMTFSRAISNLRNNLAPIVALALFIKTML